MLRNQSYLILRNSSGLFYSNLKFMLTSINRKFININYFNSFTCCFMLNKGWFKDFSNWLWSHRWKHSLFQEFVDHFNPRFRHLAFIVEWIERTSGYFWSSWSLIFPMLEVFAVSSFIKFSINCLCSNFSLRLFNPLVWILHFFSTLSW